MFDAPTLEVRRLQNEKINNVQVHAENLNICVEPSFIGYVHVLRRGMLPYVHDYGVGSYDGSASLCLRLEEVPALIEALKIMHKELGGVE